MYMSLSLPPFLRPPHNQLLSQTALAYSSKDCHNKRSPSNSLKCNCNTHYRALSHRPSHRYRLQHKTSHRPPPYMGSRTISSNSNRPPHNRCSKPINNTPSMDSPPISTLTKAKSPSSRHRNNNTRSLKLNKRRRSKEDNILLTSANPRLPTSIHQHLPRAKGKTVLMDRSGSSDMVLAIISNNSIRRRTI